MAYYLTINIEAAGTPLTLETGGKSIAGHMWYSLSDEAGNVDNYGFGPIETGLTGQGEPKRHDNDLYAGDPAYSRTIEITEEQYNKMREFGENPFADGKFDQLYNVRSNSCVDFVYKALEEGGLNITGNEGNWIPMGNAWKIDWLLCGNFPINGNGTCPANFTSAQKALAPVRRDPLVLDLDGDGIETIAASATNPVLFDHDGDGLKTGTGWISPDDGFLVMDRNNNGVIDSGRELFGDSTLLYTGGAAADGFAALAQEDTNQDGVVNSLDANWCRPLKSIHMLRCAAVLGVATYTESTPHVCGFARLASERI